MGGECATICTEVFNALALSITLDVENSFLYSNKNNCEI